MVIHNQIFEHYRSEQREIKKAVDFLESKGYMVYNKEKKYIMKAVGKYIVITEIVEQQKTDSGILLTSDDSNQLRYKKGLIVIPGTQVDVVKEGDVIYFDKASGHKMMLNDEMVSIIQERDIVVVL